MLKNNFFKTIPFLLFIILLNSCDKEFSAIGGDLIDENTFSIQKSEYPIVAYNQKIGPVQTNNLETNQFGVLVNPAFGTTTANFVTQLTLASAAPTFDITNTKIKSVVLSVPYFVDKTKTVLNSDGSSTYVLDSIYGPDKARMKLSVYESGYFLRNYDPETQLTQPQKYYSDQYATFSQSIIGSALNDDADTTQNTDFFFDPKEHSVTTTTDGKETTTRTPPAMQLNLNKDFFTSKILGAPASALASDAAFKDYFRGLLFNIESIGGNPGDLAMINFRAGTITITYTQTVSGVDTDSTLVLNLTGNTVNLLNQTNTNDKYTSATNPANVNKDKGDLNLYLKGGEGSMSVLKLFNPTDLHGLVETDQGYELTDVPNGVPDDLDILRKNKYLINEADVTFYLNSAEMGDSYIPRRLYLYDYKNSKILLDYNESTTVSSDPKLNKYVFSGLLGKDSNGAYFYKFRITNHIRNLVKTLTAENVELGVVVTEDINKYAFYSLENSAGMPLYVPVASVMNPLGAIVFGNNIPADNENFAKRLKFEIYYTKPN